jgi:hypothetical protein
MRAQLRSLCWLFIFAVALLDIGFAIRFRESFHDWELNPVGRWVFASWGIWGLSAFRVAATTFAWRIAYTRARGRHLVTGVWLTAHVVLAFHLAGCLTTYFQAYYYPTFPMMARS